MWRSEGHQISPLRNLTLKWDTNFQFQSITFPTMLISVKKRDVCMHRFLDKTGSEVEGAELCHLLGRRRWDAFWAAPCWACCLLVDGRAARKRSDAGVEGADATPAQLRRPWRCARARNLCGAARAGCLSNMWLQGNICQRPARGTRGCGEAAAVAALPAFDAAVYSSMLRIGCLVQPRRVAAAERRQGQTEQNGIGSDGK